MKNIRKYLCSASLSLAMLSSSIGAQATAFDFDVMWDGSTATLDSGSDNPIGAVLVGGDTFNFNAQTAGDDFWKVDTADSFFPFFAFTVNETANRDANFSLNLLLDGLSQFSLALSPITNSFVHMGTNSVALAAGLMFDEILLDYTLISAAETDSNDDPTGNITDTTISRYPIGGQFPGGFTDGISYNRATASVPVPATLGLFGLGLAVLGWTRRKKA